MNRLVIRRDTWACLQQWGKLIGNQLYRPYRRLGVNSDDAAWFRICTSFISQQVAPLPAGWVHHTRTATARCLRCRASCNLSGVDLTHWPTLAVAALTKMPTLSSKVFTPLILRPAATTRPSSLARSEHWRITSFELTLFERLTLSTRESQQVRRSRLVVTLRTLTEMVTLGK